MRIRACRMAIDKAKAQSMPKDNIERAVKRGSGELDGADYQEMRYEGYGPGGTAVMVDCLTDNKNRTVAEVRHAFSKFGGNLGADGSVNYLFQSRRAVAVPERRRRRCDHGGRDRGGCRGCRRR